MTDELQVDYGVVSGKPEPASTYSGHHYMSPGENRLVKKMINRMFKSRINKQVKSRLRTRAKRRYSS